MRWMATPEPHEGDLRCQVRFAWYPVRFGNMWIWLERYVEQLEYRSAWHEGRMGGHSSLEWVLTAIEVETR